MSARLLEHLAFARNLLSDAQEAVALADRDDIDQLAAAYQQLMQARVEVSAAIAHLQIHAPRAVLEANRVRPREAAAAHIRREARAAFPGLSRAEALIASGAISSPSTILNTR